VTSERNREPWHPLEIFFSRGEIMIVDDVENLLFYFVFPDSSRQVLVFSASLLLPEVGAAATPKMMWVAIVSLTDKFDEFITIIGRMRRHSKAKPDPLLVSLL